MKINASPNNMVPVEVAQASDLQLNWLVAQIVEEEVWFNEFEDCLMHRDREEDGERACAGINRFAKLPGTTGVPWVSGFGDSYLRASMRCLVISRMGDIAQVPHQIIDLESE